MPVEQPISIIDATCLAYENKFKEEYLVKIILTHSIKPGERLKRNATGKCQTGCRLYNLGCSETKVIYDGHTPTPRYPHGGIPIIEPVMGRDSNSGLRYYR